MEPEISASLSQTIHLLNEALAADPKAISALVEFRVPVGDGQDWFMEHPTIQCSLERDGDIKVGFLGMLNGIFGAESETGFGYITAHVEEDGVTISSFEVTDFEAVKAAMVERKGDDG